MHVVRTGWRSGADFTGEDMQQSNRAQRPAGSLRSGHLALPATCSCAPRHSLSDPSRILVSQPNTATRHLRTSTQTTFPPWSRVSERIASPKATNAEWCAHAYRGGTQAATKLPSHHHACVHTRGGEAHVGDGECAVILDLIVAEVELCKRCVLHLPHAAADDHRAIVTQHVAPQVELLHTQPAPIT